MKHIHALQCNIIIDGPCFTNETLPGECGGGAVPDPAGDFSDQICVKQGKLSSHQEPVKQGTYMPQDSKLISLGYIMWSWTNFAQKCIKQ